MTACIKLYGERNTGTNYVQRLLAVNLIAEQLPGTIPESTLSVMRCLPGREWHRDLWWAVHPRNLGWKHGVPPRRSAAGGYGIITVTKNPYSWCLSLHRRPHHPTHPQDLDFETFLATPWRTVGRDNMRRARLANPVELWNRKNRAYLDLPGALNVTYESVLGDPKAFVDRVSGRFGIEKTAAYWRNHQPSTKEPGKTFAFYRQYYLGEWWRASLSAPAVEVINAALDWDLAARFGYAIESPVDRDH